MKLKSIKNISMTVVAVLAIAACSEDLERADYISFEGKSAELETPLTGSGSGEYKVYTTAIAGSDRTFSIVVDTATTTANAAEITVPATVTVPANSNVGTFTVTSSSANIGSSIVLNFVPDESTIVGTAFKIEVFEECLDNLLFLDLAFDTYSEEFAWQITDSDDNLVAGNEGFGEYPRASYRRAKIRERICLADGAYTFVAYDQYGDGLDDGSTKGRFDLRRVSDGEVLASGEGAFESGAPFEFTLP